MKRKYISFFMMLFILPSAYELKGEAKESPENLIWQKNSNIEMRNFSAALIFFKSGEYFRAETEFLRPFFLNRENMHSYYGWQAKLFLNRIRLIQRRNNEALVSLSVASPLLNILEEKEIIPDKFFSDWKKDLAFAQFQNGMYRKSAHMLNILKMERQKEPAPASQEEARQLQEMAHAAESLDKFFSDEEHGFTIRKRRPWLAGLISFFIPGLGQVYNGEYGLGLLSFSAVGTLGTISYFSFLKKNYVGAYLSLYLALVFHGHNINRAIESSWHFNEALAEKEIHYYELKFTRYLHWWPE